MIEMRVVEHELGVKPDIQYRYKYQLPSEFISPDSEGQEWVWSDWQTAPYVNAAEI